MIPLATDSGDSSCGRETELETPQAQRDLSMSLENRGRAAQGLGDWPAARKYYDESVAIWRRLAEQLGTPEAQRELGESLARAYGMADREGDREAACDYLKDALNCFEQVAQQSPNPRIMEVLASVRSTLAGLRGELNSMQTAPTAWSSILAVIGRLLEQIRQWMTRRR